MEIISVSTIDNTLQMVTGELWSQTHLALPLCMQ